MNKQHRVPPAVAAILNGEPPEEFIARARRRGLVGWRIEPAGPAQYRDPFVLEHGVEGLAMRWLAEAEERPPACAALLRLCAAELRRLLELSQSGPCQSETPA